MLVVAACSATGDASHEPQPSSGDHSTGAGGAGQGTDPGDLALDSGEAGSGGAASDGRCEPPDVLIALDRTLTMIDTPSGVTPTDAPAYASSKWAQAIAAIETLVAPPADAGIRFGLELWPREEPGCVTLPQRLHGVSHVTNPFCEDGEVLVSPAIGTGGAIGARLDPATTKLCISTPTGAGLLAGADHLGSIATPGRDQYILLVTDGADWDQTCAMPDPVSVTHELAQRGIKTFVVGFSATGDILSGGVGAPFLNEMACAGMTAKDFATRCAVGPTGHVAVDPTGPTLYLQASDGAALSTALGAVAGSICCGCLR